MTPSIKELWIGGARVKQSIRGGTLGDADEAFVNVIALASSRSNFRRRIKTAVEEIGLDLIRLKDAEPLELRLTKHSIHRDLKRIAKYAERTGEVGFDVFYAFDHVT